MVRVISLHRAEQQALAPAVWDLELRASPEGGAWDWEVRLRIEEHDAVLEASSVHHTHQVRLPRRDVAPLLARLRAARVPLWVEPPEGDGASPSLELTLGRAGAPRIQLRWAGAVPAGWEAATEILAVLGRHVPLHVSR